METENVIHIVRHVTPVGPVILGCYGGDRLCMCDWPDSPKHVRLMDDLRRKFRIDMTPCRGLAVIDDARRQLEEYFRGDRRNFTIPLQPLGTEFQCHVASRLPMVPYGETVTYGEFARMIGMPRSVRAVASSVGANTLSIFLPCHRIVPSVTPPGNYRGGEQIKKKLLALEQGASES